MRAPSGRFLVGLWALALVLSGGALWLVLSSDHTDHKAATAALALTAGLSFVTSGLVAMWRRPENQTGVLLTLTGFLWYLSALPTANDEWVFTVGLLVNEVAFAPFAQLILAFPSGRLQTRFDKLLVTATWALVIFTPIAVALSGSTTSDCSGCPDSTIAIWHSDRSGSVINALANVLALAIIAAVVAVLVRRWHGASPALRRALTPVVVTGIASISLLAASTVASFFSRNVADLFSIAFLAAFATVPIAFLLGVLRSRLARSAVSDLVVELGTAPTTSTLQEALARALHDPSLEILYPLGSDRYVDAEGRPESLPAPGSGRAATLVERDGRRVAALVHDPTILDERELLEAVSAAAALALDNERLQAELRGQFEFLVTIVDTAPSLLVAVDTDGRIVNFNVAVERASGLDEPEEIRGKRFWDVFIDEPERDELRERFQAAAPEFEPTEYENSFTNARGEELVIAWVSAPLRDEQGQVVRVIAGGIDVTERKRKELELQSSQERLQAVIASSPVAIVEIDLEDRVLTWNDAAERTFGWTAAEVVGQPVPVIPDELVAESRQLDLELRAGATYTGREARRRRKDGTVIDVQISAAPVRDSSGRVVSLMAIYLDVTERKQSEAQLQGERDFLDKLGDTVPTLLVLTDTEGRILGDGVNKAYRDTFRRTSVDSSRHSFLEFVHPDDDYAARMAIASAANGVEQRGIETRWLRSDAAPITVAWAATPITHPLAGDLVLITGTDISDRKRAEEEIRASRSRILEAGDAERQRLERNLHDGAQQRLVSLSLSLRLAQAKLQSDPAEADGLLAASREELAQAIDELRELARGIHPAVLTDRGLEAALETLATRAPLPVELDVMEERLPDPVEAAAYFIVSEALTNVAKYARATAAHVAVRLDDGAVVVEVADDGSGGADPAGGTGLRGLADRVATLDGALEVESEPGSGTVVRAVIPVRAPALSK